MGRHEAPESLSVAASSVTAAGDDAAISLVKSRDEPNYRQSLKYLDTQSVFSITG